MTPTVPELARSVAARLTAVPGVAAVSLGGSYARGTARPDSDIDLGLYYDAAWPFNLDLLAALCRELDDSGTAEPSVLGGWGPWVDGGAWLTIQGQRLDIIYRELGRVAASVEDALIGRVTLHAQPLHPHGVHGHHYAAELALGVLLSDPGGRLAALQLRLGGYPEPLRAALMAHYGWQPDFWLEHTVVKGLQRGDIHWAQGCAYQSIMAMVQDLCARDRIWITNEKAAVALAGSAAGAPHDFEARVNAALRALDVAALRQLRAEC